MSRLPIFLKEKNLKFLLFGSGKRAQRKLRYLLNFDVSITVIFSDVPSFELGDLPSIQLTSLANIPEDAFEGAFAFVAASDFNDDNVEVAAQARNHGLLVHITENEADSDFILPALINRGPISIAVSSGGTHPTLTRILRSQVEATIPSRIGSLGEIAARYRDRVRSVFKAPQKRREFWEKQFEGRFAELVYAGKDEQAEQLLEQAIDSSLSDDRPIGEVYLVGAGPGDPDLLSFKALRLMRQADVVLYDRLVSPAILAMVRHDADLIDVGKERSRHTMPQESINDLLVRLASEGHRVLRLKGGDPFIFGRGGEEIEKLASLGIPFQVVPGITAAAGCASYAGIPLTHRDYAQSVRFVTGHLKNNTSNLVWQDLVQHQQTLVFYMGLNALSEIVRGLMGHGMAQEMPVAVISKGTLPDQQVLVSSLGEIELAVGEAKVQAPTIIIVGEVVTLHSRLNWKKPV